MSETEGAPSTGPEGSEGEGADDEGVSAPAASNDWWQFGSKADAETWANDLVSKRLSRHKKTTVDPIAAERDKLKAEVEELRPLREATQTDSERWESKFNAQAEELNSLRESHSKSERDNQVRTIADEMGLPSSFLSRVSGSDEDSIREDIKSVLDALSEGGFNTGKKTPAPKNPVPKGKSGGGSVGSGGGSDSDEPDDDSLSKSIIEAASKNRSWGLGR